MSKEDEVQIALGLKFKCFKCVRVLDSCNKSSQVTYFNETVCAECAFEFCRSSNIFYPLQVVRERHQMIIRMHKKK
jgi:hypothetical protein